MSMQVHPLATSTWGNKNNWWLQVWGMLFFLNDVTMSISKRNKKLNQMTSKIPVVTFIRLEHLKKGPCSKERPVFHYFSGDMLVLGEVLYICLVCFHVRVYFFSKVRQEKC